MRPFVHPPFLSKTRMCSRRLADKLHDARTMVKMPAMEDEIRIAGDARSQVPEGEPLDLSRQSPVR